MRGFRASRAVHNNFSSRFGKQSSNTNHQTTGFGSHGPAAKPELPAWLKVHTNPNPVPSGQPTAKPDLRLVVSAPTKKKKAMKTVSKHRAATPTKKVAARAKTTTAARAKKTTRAKKAS